MNIGSIIFFILSGLATILHFLFMMLKKEVAFKITKPLCLLFLAIGAVFLVPNKPVIYIGIFFASISDLLLIKRNDRTFLLFGTVSFLLSQIAFFISLCSFISASGIDIPFWIYIVIVCSAVLISLIFYPFGVHIIGRQSIPFTIYLAFLFLCILSSIQILIILPNKGPGTFMLLGYLSLITSIVFLGFYLRLKQVDSKNVYIRGTYLIGVFLIAIGLLLACF